MKNTEVLIPPLRGIKTSKAISMIYISSIYQYHKQYAINVNYIPIHVNVSIMHNF